MGGAGQNFLVSSVLTAFYAFSATVVIFIGASYFIFFFLRNGILLGVFGRLEIPSERLKIYAL